ncbi:MAG: thioesterase family protein [Rhodoferax sp.]|uniref:acyl-CoA thioesterase n=1 Tax=Rhodoferax sp. TaxID=50421 RepID=UPI00261E6884|nr:thioesterase family protein [Rhodoferax sp.]MDD5333545.1 thioesterase family protein [Rhodoferax sp.]
MSDALLTYRGTIYPWHCDHVGHMNVMWYVGKFDEATWQFFNLLSLTPTFLRTQQRGMAAVDQHISYLQELHAGDVVAVRSALIEVKEKSIRFVHEMSNEESHEIVARTTLKAVHMDTQLRKSCAFPSFVATRAATLFGGGVPAQESR